MTEADILRDFPDLRSEHVRAALAFAAERERRQRSATAGLQVVSVAPETAR